MPRLVTISAAVEGIVDEAVVRRLIACAGGHPGPIHGKNGKLALRQKINGYNNAARHTPWVVLVDLNSDADCAPRLRRDWLPTPDPWLCFRVAVREVEAWLMADAETLASYLRIPKSIIPPDPESLPDPKAAIVNLARQSRTRAIRADMVPRPGSRREVGSAYTSRLVEYASEFWRPDVAAQRANSLRRAIHCLRRLVEAKA
jgi:hypothetical protein